MTQLFSVAAPFTISNSTYIELQNHDKEICSFLDGLLVSKLSDLDWVIITLDVL